MAELKGGERALMQAGVVGHVHPRVGHVSGSSPVPRTHAVRVDAQQCLRSIHLSF